MLWAQAVRWITASNFGTVHHNNTFQTPTDLLRSILWPSSMDSCANLAVLNKRNRTVKHAMRYGSVNEKVALHPCFFCCCCFVLIVVCKKTAVAWFCRFHEFMAGADLPLFRQPPLGWFGWVVCNHTLKSLVFGFPRIVRTLQVPRMVWFVFEVFFYLRVVFIYQRPQNHEVLALLPDGRSYECRRALIELLGCNWFKRSHLPPRRQLKHHTNSESVSRMENSTQQQDCPMGDVHISPWHIMIKFKGIWFRFTTCLLSIICVPVLRMMGLGMCYFIVLTPSGYQIRIWFCTKKSVQNQTNKLNPTIPRTWRPACFLLWSISLLLCFVVVLWLLNTEHTIISGITWFCLLSESVTKLGLTTLSKDETARCSLCCLCSWLHVVAWQDGAWQAPGMIICWCWLYKLQQVSK